MEEIIDSGVSRSNPFVRLPQHDGGRAASIDAFGYWETKEISMIMEKGTDFFRKAIFDSYVTEEIRCVRLPLMRKGAQYALRRIMECTPADISSNVLPRCV